MRKRTHIHKSKPGRNVSPEGQRRRRLNNIAKRSRAVNRRRGR
jgi:hypothetical protein